jgi:hypothetical protein
MNVDVPAILDEYRRDLKSDYNGEYLDEQKLTRSFSYDKVVATIIPDENKHRVFSGNIRFFGDDKETLNFNFVKLKLVDNFGGKRIDKKLKPHYDGQFDTSGHNHTFYSDVETILVEKLQLDPRLQCWVSLLNNYRNEFKPEDFGLAVIYVEDDKFNLFVKYNAFEWDGNLLHNRDLNTLKAETVSKILCQSKRT